MRSASNNSSRHCASTLLPNDILLRNSLVMMPVSPASRIRPKTSSLRELVCAAFLALLTVRRTRSGWARRFAPTGDVSSRADGSLEGMRLKGAAHDLRSGKLVFRALVFGPVRQATGAKATQPERNRSGDSRRFRRGTSLGPLTLKESSGLTWLLTMALLY
jgi:hypothetical protein